MADNPFARFAPSAGGGDASKGPVYGPPPVAAKPPSSYEQGRDDVEDKRKGKDTLYDQTMSLRQKYDQLPQVQEYRVMATQYAQALRTDSTPGGDLALVYAFAKAMDPGSVVREGEAAAVSSADTMAGQLAAKLKKELTDSGGAFRPEYRNQLRREIHNKVTEGNRAYNAQRQRAGDDARAFGLDPERVIGEHDGSPYMGIIQDYWAQHGGNPMQGAPGQPKPRPKPAGGGGGDIDAILRKHGVIE